MIEEGETLAVVSDPFGEVEIPVVSDRAGLIVGRTVFPSVNEGDAVFHLAQVSDMDDVEETLEFLSSQLEEDPLFEEDAIT